MKQRLQFFKMSRNLQSEVGITMSTATVKMMFQRSVMLSYIEIVR